ncbi:hypothetical protein VOLCADRAFT_107702 [Volvox carteri f. nagariensis]|uniref:polyribonucleotide nucleotidyltransferase n=1 Tax=Volvox carteri f. nagariensis TaxID=3068 RepID=D8UFR1_VOLCA|nr:uncharacterized protein VOLCADRAFT_107702 [Volvox carteri f. nagariensis]EFJ41423.1 hypothetical protein VOLCADRAFT_107702 [Volvox carteri f. nagariensis]|eukprot:XP_002957529.1 hypothetical protein VOLCADRAFT_107702 [Volvox carteri f. nagariensis]
MATCGETMIYATACCSASPTGDGSFLPLTVNYAERFSAAGRTSGGYVKRDGRPRDSEVLVSRLVDRPLRPMFGKGWANETQVLEWVLSYDGIHNPEPIAITAAAAALLISDIPLKKAVAGVRVGLLPDEGYVVNPTVEQMKVSRLDLMVAGTRDAILMIEGFCDFLTEEQMIEALAVGSQAITSLCLQMEDWAKKVGKPKRTESVVSVPDDLEERVMALVGPQLREAYRTSLSKEVRGAAVAEAQAMATAKLGAATDGNGTAAPYTALQISMALKVNFVAGVRAEMFRKGPGGKERARLLRGWVAGWLGVGGGGEQHPPKGEGEEEGCEGRVDAWRFPSVESRVMRSLVLEEGIRADGRRVTDIRPIASRAGLLPRTHGSALFTRGETQAICVATLGTASDALRADTMRKAEEDDGGEGRFYLQYHFPPSSVGETGRVGGPGRRELGHGELAQRALAPIVPNQEQFPYTVRLESTITESNGSSSMASVCGGCLALQDAGVPILRPVAGIAMGLILEPAAQNPDPESGSGSSSPRHVVLSDILGSEDALGDMDFKVAGDTDSITAFQMDIKVEGITLEIMSSALNQAREGRRHILQQMERCSPPPAGRLNAHAPRLLRTMVGGGPRGELMCEEVDPAKIGAIIGTGGRTIKQLKEVTGVTAIELDEDGRVNVVSPSQEAAARAMELINLLVSDPEPGTVLRQRAVTSVAAFGCFVELCPGRQGLVHVSELADPPPSDVGSVVAVGDKIDVMVMSCDGGKVALSRRAVALLDQGEGYPKFKRAAPGGGERGVGVGGGRTTGMAGPGLVGGRGGGSSGGGGGGRGIADRNRRT